MHRVYFAKSFSELSYLLILILTHFSQYFKSPFAPLPLLHVVLLYYFLFLHLPTPISVSPLLFTAAIESTVDTKCYLIDMGTQ